MVSFLTCIYISRSSPLKIMNMVKASDADPVQFFPDPNPTYVDITFYFSTNKILMIISYLIKKHLGTWKIKN